MLSGKMSGKSISEIIPVMLICTKISSCEANTLFFIRTSKTWRGLIFLLFELVKPLFKSNVLV